MTQNLQVLELLRQAPLTPLGAMQKLGVMRLAARIHDLRSAGHDIVVDRLEVNTRNGKAHVARYRLKR